MILSGSPPLAKPEPCPLAYSYCITSGQFFVPLLR